MASLRLVVVLPLVLFVASIRTEDVEKKDTVAQDASAESSSDLQPAETKDLLYALKSKVESLFPFKSSKRSYSPSYRQYHSSPPNYGYEYRYRQSPVYTQQGDDCYDNGYSYSTGYYGVPSRSNFIGGKPAYSTGSGGNYPSGQGSFGGSFSGSASFGSSASSSGGYFKPSYYSYSSYEVPTQSGGNFGYYSSNYPSYQQKPSFNPTNSYYYSGGAQVQQPQYYQSSVPVQPVDYNSQSVYFASTPKTNTIETSTPAYPAPAPVPVSVFVPSGPPQQGPVPVPPSPVPSSQRSESGPASVAITPRPPGSPAVLSIYSSDTYLSRPYVYSPAYAYRYQYTPGVSSYPKYNGYYNQQGYAGGIQYDPPAVYPGGLGGYPNAGNVNPASAPATPDVNC